MFTFSFYEKHTKLSLVILKGKVKILIIIIIHMTSSGKTWLMEEQKEQVLIRRCMFCAVSDQSLDFLSHISICGIPFSCFLHNLKTTYEYKYIEKAYLGKHYLLLHKQGLPIFVFRYLLCSIYTQPLQYV